MFCFWVYIDVLYTIGYSESVVMVTFTTIILSWNLFTQKDYENQFLPLITKYVEYSVM